MTYDVLGPGALDYFPCRYGRSKLMFRGPQRDLAEPYIAFLGGTRTYGKFIEMPFPALVEQRIGMPCVNLGQPNAGIDAFVHDRFVTEAAARAEKVVLQVMGAQNMSNRFYTVHPRRNDRFVAPSKLLQAIFPEVDFADFHFTGHLLQRLEKVSPERFAAVRTELQRAWVARMKLLLGQIGKPCLLLWVSDRRPDAVAEQGLKGAGFGPLFVTRKMLDSLRDHAAGLVEVVVSLAAVAAGTEGMVFTPLEELAAQQMLGPMAHAECAAALSHELQGA
ncbi:hypothetical protein BOO69_01795 [Sulfitobacter alexandrii]|uniref:DUF6473 domain-containing protein n=1 Tax=Sulfitobacter alexandrii TaxID=1917485 RepID=A0A1J0WLW3_9RHOB|nr:DUF6473 family protein [Sulfitobacter alexandrii]APE45237.1 hypothetical protein BOO69_01795 [Sulfitobacter alexandrii]